MGEGAALLSLCVSLTKPTLVVETGVGAGFSTTFFLQTLKMNNHEKLYSLDFYKDDEPCGWIIPNNLENRWELARGLSGQGLNPLLEQLGEIEVFIYDAGHSYENMMTEFGTVRPFLKSGGVFLAYEVGRNDALFDFCREVNFS